MEMFRSIATAPDRQRPGGADLHISSLQAQEASSSANWHHSSQPPSPSNENSLILILRRARTQAASHQPMPSAHLLRVLSGTNEHPAKPRATES